ANRLGHRVRACERDRKEHEEEGVGEHAGRPAELDQGRRRQAAEPETARGDSAVRKADGGRVAPRVEVEQGCARCAEGRAGGEALDAARRATSSEPLPASRRVTSTPNAYVA